MQNCIMFCFIIYHPSNMQNIYNVITKERSHWQTRLCSIKDCCYHVSHCGLSDSLSATVNVVLIRTGKQKQPGEWWSTLDCLKVILRIIRIPLSERVTSSKDWFCATKTTGWSVGAQFSWACIVYIATRSTRSEAASITCHNESYQIHFPCHSIKEQWLRPKRKRNQEITIHQWLSFIMRRLKLCVYDACLFHNLMKPRSESIMCIWIVQITPRSTASPIKSSPTPHDPIPLI